MKLLASNKNSYLYIIKIEELKLAVLIHVIVAKKLGSYLVQLLFAVSPPLVTMQFHKNKAIFISDQVPIRGEAALFEGFLRPAV